MNAVQVVAAVISTTVALAALAWGIWRYRFGRDQPPRHPLTVERASVSDAGRTYTFLVRTIGDSETVPHVRVRLCDRTEEPISSSEKAALRPKESTPYTVDWPETDPPARVRVEYQHPRTGKIDGFFSNVDLPPAP